MGTRTASRIPRAAVAVALGVTVLVGAACSSPAAAPTSAGTITAVGAENQYANVISQIGGRVRATDGRS